MAPTNDPASGNWHLDRRVPLSLIAAIAIQTLVVASVLTTKSIQIDDHERRIARHEEFTRQTDAAINDWVRRAAARQVSLEEHAARLMKLEKSDAEVAATTSAILQQLSRIDERTAQLTSVVVDLRNELRRQQPRPFPQSPP